MWMRADRQMRERRARPAAHLRRVCFLPLVCQPSLRGSQVAREALIAPVAITRPAPVLAHEGSAVCALGRRAPCRRPPGTGFTAAEFDVGACCSPILAAV